MQQPSQASSATTYPLERNSPDGLIPLGGLPRCCPWSSSACSHR